MPGNSRAKFTRREFVGGAIGASVGAEVLRPISQVYGAQAASGSTRTTGIDQNPIRRRGTGLRALDANRASAGLTLFSPIESDGIVYLISLDGKVVHTWKMPYPPPFKGGVTLEADWTGKVLWEVRHPNHHHDGRLLRNGNVILLCATELPDDVAKKVQGGRPGTEEKGKIWADYLVEMTRDGRMVWEWRSWEHLDPAKDTITAIQDKRSEWTHGNAIAELPDGNLLVSFRDISTIIKIERQSGHIVWSLGAPPLSGQHAPTPLPNGNILIFDNGPHRLDESFPFSRVIEVNPRTNDIVWKYQEGVASNFFSPRISNAQRLPNGNTLINDGWFGRFFEVTLAGDVVWEYVNPYFGPATEPAKAQNNSVFRVYRYTDKEIARAQAAI